MHKIIAAQAFFVVFLPISTDSDDFERVLGQCDDIGQLDVGKFAVLVLVFKALEVQIDQLLKQKHLSLVIRGPNTGNFVNCLLDLACIGRRGVGIQVHIEVFTGYCALAVLVGVHCNAVREPRALRHDA